MKPGDYFLSQIGGKVGFLIRLGQGLAGDWSRYTHAGIVLDDGTVIAGQPGGARIDPVASLEGSKVLAVSRNELTDDERARIVARARSMEGTPYSFLDYLAIVLLAFGIKPKRLRKFIEDSGHMICSQFVDAVYEAEGINLFHDGRAHGDVTPGDLAQVGVIEHLSALIERS